MTAETMRGFVRALCDALATRNAEAIAPYLHDDIEWTFYGPVDLFPFFGQRKGKAAVLRVVQLMIETIELRQCEPERRLTDGDHTAALMRVNALHLKTGRTLSVRLAQFLTARDGKIASMKVLLDTLDAAEQTLGREIDLSQVA